MRETRNVLFLSQEEAAYAQSLCEELRPATVPPVFDYEPAIRKPRKPSPPLELGLLGNFGWWPNQLGLRWFVREVLPSLKSPVRLNLFGQPGGRRWKGHPRIREHGTIEEIQQVWDTCDLMICPSFSSAGVRVKLAEAIYNGVPVLATNLAARGLPIDPDAALIFFDAARDWIDFLNSSAAWQLAGRQVSEKTKAPFAADAQKIVLQQFVQDAICAGSAGATI
jgi:glycosyltransferase involved in cell wall biosynthesis